MDFTLVNNCDELRLACETLQSAEAVGVDCETTDLAPHNGRLRLIQLSDGQKTFVIDAFSFTGDRGYEPLKRLIESKKPRAIAHNAKFEQKWLSHALGISLDGIFDTLLASILIDYTPGTHGLEAVAKTYLDETLDKSEQRSDWTGELSESQLRYAARDAQILVPLRQAMRDRLREEDLVRAAQLEFEAVPAFAAMELAGIYLDADLWKEQLAVVRGKHATLSDELQEMLSDGASQGTLFARPEINLDSHTQVLAALKQMKVPLDRSTRNNILLPLEKGYPVVAKLLEYRTVSKALTSYGENWLQAISPVTGRVHPDFNQIGAPTGRASCVDPNLQQVPHSIEYRRCFRAPEGRKFCTVDFSQIELRILADITRDPGFMSAFNSGADLHKTTASQIFNVPMDSVTKEQRDFAKRLNFGVVYGIGAQRFSNMTGMSMAEAEALLNKYFRTYPVLDAWLRASSQQALKHHFVRTLSGRIIRYKFDPEDKQAVGEVKRAARNGPVQGTSADIIKRALKLVHDALRGTSSVIVNVIHDELVVEADAREAEGVAQLVSEKMVEAGSEYIHDVPVKAEPAISQEWNKD